MSKTGYVYVIAAGERRVKIGISRDPEMRLASLQTACPVRLTLAHFVRTRDAKAAEERAHALLAASRLHGEWFDVETAAAIKAVDRAARRSTMLDEDETPISGMKGAEFHAGLTRLGLAPYDAPRFFGIDRERIYNYTRNERPIPELIAKLLRAYLRHGLSEPELAS